MCLFGIFEGFRTSDKMLYEHLQLFLCPFDVRTRVKKEHYKAIALNKAS